MYTATDILEGIGYIQGQDKTTQFSLPKPIDIFLHEIEDETQERLKYYLPIFVQRLQKMHGIGNEKFWERNLLLGLQSLLNATLYHYKIFYFNKIDKKKIQIYFIKNCIFLTFADSLSSRTKENNSEIYLAEYMNLFATKSNITLAGEIIFKKDINCKKRKYKKPSLWTRIQFKILRMLFSKKKTTLGLVSSYISPDTRVSLLQKSFGKIRDLTGNITQFTCEQTLRDANARKGLTAPLHIFDDNFEQYFLNCLSIYFPSILLENFTSAYAHYAKEWENFPILSHIISEAYIAMDTLLFALSVAGEQGKQIIGNEHFGGFFCLYKNLYSMHEIPDVYFAYSQNFMGKNICSTGLQHDFQVKSTGKYVLILPSVFQKYFVYSYGIDARKCTLKESFESMQGIVDIFIRTLKNSIRECLFYKHSPWNKIHEEQIYELKFNNILEIDPFESVASTIKQAKIVIYTDISSVYLHTLVSNIPTIILLDPIYKTLTEKHQETFQDLVDAKIIFYDPVKAAQHLNSVYDNPDIWWKSKKTQKLLQHFLYTHILNGNAMSDCLLLMASGKPYTIESLQEICDKWHEHMVREKNFV